LNRAALVGRAVESALAQTHASVEIIVSNNGSTDDTRAVLDRYAGAPRLRILHRETTIPATDHGTFLVEQARGEFFVGLSDDDWLLPEFAERAVALYDSRPGLAFVWTGCMMHYGEVATPAKTGPEVERGTDFLAAFLAGRRDVCWCACVTRTADLREIGPIPRDVICGDMFYWTKIAQKGDVGCVPEILSHYVAYRHLGDGNAGGTPVLTWAADSARWTHDIVAACKDALDAAGRKQLEHDAAVFLARTTANQFVWNAMRGARRLRLLKTIRPAMPYLIAPDPTPWIRVVAALLAPRWMLRSRMLAEARRRARAAEAAQSK
jgi:glycosyltransferase involved in cell wall biosynthesis